MSDPLNADLYNMGHGVLNQAYHIAKECWMRLPLDSPWEFFTSALVDDLPREFKWQQVSRTLLSILADLHNDVVWMVSTRPLLYKDLQSLYQSFGDCAKGTN